MALISAAYWDVVPNFCINLVQEAGVWLNSFCIYLFYILGFK
ncbi:DUF4466 family protein [Marinomonas sp. CT5]|nr:DUF4466 family protein [Marinomonas sp. CT5]